ncbi:c-type cytochrome [Pedobacter helvus]|uniref:C-type cytochrome n=1 Tax=Pedobacter helvus TaxID=2563444 RepID=A0ABW9JDE4_9SPHI|nr:cytochrome c [Pedobacter ureilyticus]
MDFSTKYKQLWLLSLISVCYVLLFSCNLKEENELQEAELDREITSNAYKQKCSPCHAVGYQLIGPALAQVTDYPDTLVKKYKAQEKCHVGVGKASKKELELIIEYLKISNVFPDPTLNSF